VMTSASRWPAFGSASNASDVSEPDWQVVLLRDARRYVDRLPSSEQTRILDALAEVERAPFAAPVKPLHGRPE
jgi:hypothetical protein